MFSICDIRYGWSCSGLVVKCFKCHLTTLCLMFPQSPVRWAHVPLYWNHPSSSNLIWWYLTLLIIKIKVDIVKYFSYIRHRDSDIFSVWTGSLFFGHMLSKSITFGYLFQFLCSPVKSFSCTLNLSTQCSGHRWDLSPHWWVRHWWASKDRSQVWVYLVHWIRKAVVAQQSVFAVAVIQSHQ